MNGDYLALAARIRTELVRNVYTFNLRPSRLVELIDDLRPCLDMTTGDLTRFANLLEQLAAHDD